MANTSNMTSLQTDFNVSPYYDDFDGSKNFYRILFKPGYAVQARELTQIQSMLQDQIQKFGQHIFKEGSQVIGGKFDIEKKVAYVKIKDDDINGDTVDPSVFENQYVRGATTGLVAYVTNSIDGTEASGNTKTLYLTYTNSDANANTVVFAENEQLISNAGNIYVYSSNATGRGSVFTINEGIRFAKEHFIYHTKQSVVVDRYGSTPTCKVGFVLTEDIINADDDASLLDPALESSNFSAPGADRFKISAELTRFEIDEVVNSNNYINLFDIRNGIVQEVLERPIYNVIADEIAKRTNDESGDYYVKGLSVQVMEHLNTSNNGGYLTTAQGGDSSLIVYRVEPGLAYVKGYEVNIPDTKYIITNKANTYSNINSEILSSRIGTYVLVNEAVGAWNLNLGQKIYFYDVDQNSISNNRSSTGAPSGNNIGSGFIKSLTYDSGTIGTSTGNLKLHLFNVTMNGINTFSNVRSVFYEVGSSKANIIADIARSGNNTVVKDAYVPLIYNIANRAVRKIRGTDDITIDTTYTFRKTSDISISSTGTFTLTTSGTEVFPYGASATLTNADKTDLFLTLNANVTIALSGTITGTVSSTTMTSSTINFSRLNVGDKVKVSNNTRTYIITAIASSTSMTVDGALPSVVSGNTLSKIYINGDMIDLRGVGSTTGTTRSVSTSTNQAMAFALDEAFGSTISGTISYSVTKTSAREIAKTLKIGNYVKINVAATSNTTGPFNLGFSDIFKVKKIIKKTSSFPTSNTDGTDITRYFNLDSGQRDSYYTHGTIKPVSTTLTTSDRLLVELDYFVPDFTLGTGYFSVDSYPVPAPGISPTSTQINIAEIPKYISDAGTIFDMRDCLDFRPVYENTATETTSPASATINPSAATTIKSDGSCLRIPAESEQISFDYSYYLPRIDVLVLDKTGQFSVIQGLPSVSPQTPRVVNDSMSIARIVLQPYPSISLAYAKTIGRMDIAALVASTTNLRYTMRDIGILKNRVDQLEKYVSLNLLEKTTTDLKILDENGLDRFKNGIFVDSFSNQSLSSIFHPDHHICFDSVEKSIRPLFDTTALKYDYVSSDGDNSNTVRTGDYLMLPYTEETFFVQPFATTNRNIETSVYRFVGNIYLQPDKDFWISSTASEVIIIYDETTPYYTPYSVSYGSWQVTSGGQWERVSSNWSTWGQWYTMSAALQAMDPNTQIQYYYDNDTSKWTGAGTGYLGTGYSWVPTVTDILGKSTASTLGTYAKKPGAGWEGGISPSDLYAITTQSRTKTETFQEFVTEYTSSGEILTDVKPIADIRPQTIAFQAIGLKANTKHYVFFDGRKMSDYVTPANTAVTLQESLVPVCGKVYEDPPVNRQFIILPTGVEGSELISDRFGQAYGLLRLPSKDGITFKTGTKEVVITDSITNDEDATSLSKTYFVAQGLQQTRQEKIIATKKVITKTRQTTETQSSVLIYDRVSCMAYTFIPKVPPDEDGIFLTSFEVFFAGKDPNLGIWFEIRACDDSGNITRTQVPGSEVWLTSSQVNVSDDGTAITTVTFPTPVFLNNDTEYALVIHTQGINPNYYMWCAVLGDRDIVTGRKYNDRSLTGSLYTTNNNLDWDIVPRTDLKVRFSRAKFDTGVIGTAVIGNEPFEKVKANTVSSAFTLYGEQVSGRDRLLLSSPTNTIAVTDLLVGSTSNVNTAVSSIVGSEYRMDYFGYKPGEIVTIRRANGYNAGIATVASKNTAGGIVYDYYSNSLENMLDIRWSNGKFLQGETLTGLSSNNSLVVENLSDYVYSTVQFEPSYMKLNKTTVLFDMKTTANTGTVGTYQRIVPSKIVDFDDERRIYNKTNETAGHSNRVKVTMTSSSEYVSPVVDISQSYCIYVHNKINSNSANELLPTGGKYLNQYISQIVTLAENQDAEDLSIILSAYRPTSSNCDFHVYVRYSHVEDPEPVQSRNWIEMEFYDDTVSSSLANRQDFREFSLKLPASVLTGTSGSVTGIAQYTNSANATFTGFRQFQIKIALQSDNSAVVPRIRELRAIALQK